MQRIVKSRLVILCCLPFVFLSACQKSLPDVDFSTPAPTLSTPKYEADKYIVCNIAGAFGTIVVNQEGQALQYTDRFRWNGNIGIYESFMWLGGAGVSTVELDIPFSDSLTVIPPEIIITEEESRKKYPGGSIVFWNNEDDAQTVRMGFESVAERITYHSDNSMEVEGIPGDFTLYFYNSQGKRVDLKVSAQRRVVARMVGDELIVEEIEGDYTIETEP